MNTTVIVRKLKIRSKPMHRKHKKHKQGKKGRRAAAARHPALARAQLAFPTPGAGR